MNRRMALIVVIALALPAATALRAAGAQAESKIELEIRSVEARRFHALTSSDVPALDRILSEDLVYTHANGWRQNKAEFLAAMRSGELKYHAFTTDGETIHVYGNTAVVTGHGAAQVTVKGKELDVGLLFLEVYVRQDGRWQQVAWQSTRSTP